MSKVTFVYNIDIDYTMDRKLIQNNRES
jgi:hypothetical protein